MPKGDYKSLKADPEDGTVPIAWIFLEAIPLSQLSGLEVRCIIHLWRETYGRLPREGVRPKEIVLSLSDWVYHTGGEKSRVSRALTCLVGWNIFIREPLGVGKGYIYRMNTHISEWSDEILDKKKLADVLRVENRTTVESKTTVENRATVENKTTVEITPTVVQNHIATVEIRTTPLASNLAVENKVFKERDISIDTISPLGDVKGTFPLKAHEIWEEVLKKLRQQVSAANYRTWLENTEGAELSSSQLIIHVPNSFVADYLQKNLLGLIDKTLIETSNMKYQVTFRIAEKKPP